MSKFRSLIEHHPNPLHTEYPQKGWDELIEKISLTKLDFYHSWITKKDSEEDEH